jgi:aldehyde:ferredoxin oxidoreductase
LKLVRVNVADRHFQVETVSEEFKNLGGRAFTSIGFSVSQIRNAIPGKENPLVIAPGMLAGHRHRASIVSPWARKVR